MLTVLCATLPVHWPNVVSGWQRARTWTQERGQHRWVGGWVCEAPEKLGGGRDLAGVHVDKNASSQAACRYACLEW
jgi:hypothetical protein